MKPLLNNIYRYQKYFIIILMVFGVILGTFIAKDYGMGWDEPTSDHAGRISLDYIKNPLDTKALLWSDEMKFYGPIFEMPMAFVEESFNLTISSHNTYIFRHIVTFYLFLIGVYFFYLLCLKRFKKVSWALTGAVFLLLSPRIFADAFYNSKDIPALVFFIISIYTLVQLLEKPNIKNVLWHALACALLIDTRLPGVFVPMITLGFFVADFVLIKASRIEWSKTLKLLGIYILSLVLLVILFWPFLWQHPWTHFKEAFADMSHFTRQAGLQMLYAGSGVIASKLPWHYIPLWIFVTTPIIYLVLFIVGTGVSLGKVFMGLRVNFIKYKQDLVVLCWFFGPLLGIIVLHSIVYDGWRQLYFIYPALLYLSLIGLDSIFDLLKMFDDKVKNLMRFIIILVISLNLIGVAWFMVKNHPYQNLYFNTIVGGQENARKNFEMDYWGLTFRNGLEYIAAHDNSSLIEISFAGGSPDNVFILEPELKRRFSVLTDPNEAKYVLSNYRWQEYDVLPWDNEFYSVKVNGVNVMTVFKMK